MCVIFFAYEVHPLYPLILLANRDEFYVRPTEKAQNWKDFPEIFAGRDLVGGGTWLGVTRKGRFAAVTNYRDPSAPAGTISRGNLVADFLKTDESTEIYLKNIQTRSNDFSGFNLLVGEINSEKNELFYFSNRSGEIKKLPAGIYGLSNRLLDTPWRKIEKGKFDLESLIEQNEFSNKKFFALLADESLADDEDLPDTGIGYEREKLLSAIFIKTPIYGTRCSTVLKIGRDFKFDFEERVFI
jgi:uncharacterized protein with NRDE domain